MPSKLVVCDSIDAKIEWPCLGNGDKIIIEDDSSIGKQAYKPFEEGTSLAKPFVESIDLDSDDGVSVGVPKSPPMHNRRNFYEVKDEINLNLVNTMAEQVLQGLDTLAFVA